MDPNSLNILVEAKKEYMNQLYLVLCPHIIESFENMYKEAHKVSKGKKVLVQYQNFLKEVVNWNDHMIKQHTDEICNSCSWFSDLLAAVFVSSVKILSSVRLNNTSSNKISLKLPTNQVFIHGCFIATAKDLYKNPYIYHDEMSETDRDNELISRYSKAIETTVRDMIPVQDILKSCITHDVKPGETVDFDNTPPEDDEDPDEFVDEDEEPEPEPETEPETEEELTKNVDVFGKAEAPAPAPAPAPDQPPDPVPNVGPVVEATGGDDEDDTLFADANE